MNSASWNNAPPKRLLLATDLGARCDRALERSVLLSKQWGAELAAVHALEPAHFFAEASVPSWRQPKSPQDAARQHAVAAIREVAPEARIIIAEGDAAEVVLRTAEELQSDLIVTGVARDEPLGRLALGGTVNRLLRSAAAPLLVVRMRARRRYERIVVAVDFSPAARFALEAATRAFPKASFALFHAFDAPMSRLAGEKTAVRQQFREAAAGEAEEFLKGSDLAALEGETPQIVLEYGAPDQLLYEYARDAEVDLVVLASHGRSALVDVIIGSVAGALMTTLPCDALLMRAPR